MPRKERLKKDKEKAKQAAAHGNKTITSMFTSSSQQTSTPTAEESVALPEEESNDDDSNCSSDDIANSSDEEETNSMKTGFATKEVLRLDHRQFDHGKYEKIYKWLYYSYSQRGFMCKICTVFHGDKPLLAHGSRGAWSHRGVVFKENPGKKLRRHESSTDHKNAVLAKTNVSMEKSLAANRDDSRENANELYIGKLVQIVQFLARNNLPVKRIYPKLIDFLANEIQEPIIKQYLETCNKNATYCSHETCDSLIHSLEQFYFEETRERIQKSEDIVIYADESMSAARKEMLGIFIGSFDEADKDFKMDFIALTEVSSTKSEIVMEAVERTLREKEIDISKTRFSCLDGTNSMSGKVNGLQRRIRNSAPHALYINCRNHRLALCFKHLRDEFPWLETIDSLLLGLWKAFHFSGKNRFILKEIQEAYGLKALNIIKAALTRWLSHGAACKRCIERYPLIIEALDDIVSTNPKAELVGIRDQLLQDKTVLQITFLEDVLSITNVLSLVLQSDHKEVGALRRAIKFTKTQLRKIRDNPESPLLKSFGSCEETLQHIENFQKQNIVSHMTRKRVKVDASIEKDNFFEKVGVPFLNSLIAEMEAAFDMSCLEPVEALLTLDPGDIPSSVDEDFINFGNKEMSVLFDFYGKAITDTYQDRTVTSPALINCTLDSLKLEYGGYKNYVNERRKKEYENLLAEQKHIETRLGWANADKYKVKKKIKTIEEELQANIKKQESPLTVKDLLGDSVVTNAFPSVRYLLKLLMLVPMSEAVVERGFSKMKLIMTDSRTRLDQKSLDALMRISFQSSGLHSEEVTYIVKEWKKQKHRRIFADDF